MGLRAGTHTHTPRTHIYTHSRNPSQALELIDPLGPDPERYATPEVWNALKDLCSRRGIDYDAVKEQILNSRAEASQLDPNSRSLIRSDLCGYMRFRHDGFVRSHVETPTRDLDDLCVAVFSIALVSAYVESLFSKMTYNQNKTRNRLKDETMSAILHVHDAVLPNPDQVLPTNITLQVIMIYCVCH